MNPVDYQNNLRYINVIELESVEGFAQIVTPFVRVARAFAIAKKHKRDLPQEEIDKLKYLPVEVELKFKIPTEKNYHSILEKENIKSFLKIDEQIIDINKFFNVNRICHEESNICGQVYIYAVPILKNFNNSKYLYLIIEYPHLEKKEEIKIDLDKLI